ncbi:dGTP triphosphohydrolase [Rubidibacter lacunae]|uniref:dGTP triphosphohydrolase n=1 Tax=Rubidibacter lacunae TaxID=582514 RepID=UPI0018DB4D9B|nr:dNTP triphosphohydrolase [Rubidibacter lacunae]
MTILTDYNWDGDRETARRYPEPAPDPVDRRSPYEHDRARIIHSVAFRRLQGKTQIFAPGQAEFLRTRVTHSIEVAQIGRSLAAIAGVPDSLVEAACLAHDLGLPPFGHAGEETLDRLMQSYGGFEGNAQTLRVIARLEEKSRTYPGLNLCRSTLLGVLKYPYRRNPHRNKFLYDEDLDDYADWLFAGTDAEPIATDSKKVLPRSLVCQLMDWADDVAYSVHDMEDGLNSGFLLPSLPLRCIVDLTWQRLQSYYPSGLCCLDRDRVGEILQELRDRLEQPDSTIREVMRYYINRFVTSIAVIATRKRPRSLFDFRLEIPEAVRHECEAFKLLTLEFIICDERTSTLARKGREILTRLFHILFENASPCAGELRYVLFPRAVRPTLAAVADDEAIRARLVCDRLAGLTDGQALRLYNRLLESTGSSPFEPV